MKARKVKIDSVKLFLFEKLKEEHAFWSYDEASLHGDEVADDQLIAMTMRYLDLPEINRLFDVFPFRKIKKAWIDLLIPQGDYLHSMNRFFAWYYFKAKNPDAYLKAMETRHFNRLLSC